MEPKLLFVQLNLNLTGEPSCIRISLHAETIANANNRKKNLSIRCHLKLTIAMTKIFNKKSESLKCRSAFVLKYFLPKHEHEEVDENS